MAEPVSGKPAPERPGKPDPEKPPPERTDLLIRLRVAAALLLAFLLIVGSYYTLHYRVNSEYLASRNFRLLATLGTQVQDAVKNEGLLFGNLAKNPDLYSALSPSIISITCPKMSRHEKDRRPSSLNPFRAVPAENGRR
jgi:hypothetical protein